MGNDILVRGLGVGIFWRSIRKLGEVRDKVKLLNVKLIVVRVSSSLHPH